MARFAVIGIDAASKLGRCIRQVAQVRFDDARLADDISLEGELDAPLAGVFIRDQVLKRHTPEELQEWVVSLRRVPWVCVTGERYDAQVDKLADELALLYWVNHANGTRATGESGNGGRRGEPRNGPIQLGEMELDCSSGELLLGDIHVQLTPKECRLLELFMTNPDQVLDRQALLEHCWGPLERKENVVEVHVSRLRRKLGQSTGRLPHLQTLRGFGYRLIADR